MQTEQKKPFRFLDLPAELRDMIYDHLLEDPYFPLPPTCGKQHQHSTLPSLGWVLPGRRLSAARAGATGPRRCNWMLLANRQCYREFMDLVCMKSTIHLTVSPANYKSQEAGDETEKKLWKVDPEVLRKVKKCDIKLITTSAMLGVSDPRKMSPGEWALSSQVRSELSDVNNVEELNLHVQALGDPLWNPLWVWYHASQSFKTMGSPRPTSPSTSSEYKGRLGPTLHRITFSLDIWSPGENYLERDAEGHWQWYCMKGHCIAPDGAGVLPVREFCARLYMECRVCSPESDVEADAAR
ncbi:hypothetical protein EJ04DRAFT_451620 [Polyplosphaeria fusca]|uniref:Uncharacterized protein n=1 Tax=Polyplosphaeria fusca TaxID=682080 RepID=A0A9P4QKC3_9PLEO|nr:hypothetical protein EJ04DRAFT_451620 [Polyplosphaeria fusca]